MVRSIHRAALSMMALAQAEYPQEEMSLMQDLIKRGANRAKLDVSAVDLRTESGRKESMNKLLETATHLLKNGATPDLLLFVNETTAEIYETVLPAIERDHRNNQEQIDAALRRFEDAARIITATAEDIRAGQTASMGAIEETKTCRQQESGNCALVRQCQDELEAKWKAYERAEDQMRNLHQEIHGRWCPVEDQPPPFNLEGTNLFGPPLTDAFDWTQVDPSFDEYPNLNLPANVEEFRTFSYAKFTEYRTHWDTVKAAEALYITQVGLCAAHDDTLVEKTETCDGLQDSAEQDVCAHVSSNIQARAEFGIAWSEAGRGYSISTTHIREMEQDRVHEWENLHIVMCLLDSVNRHVTQSIETGEPCITETTNYEQTQSEIQNCHATEHETLTQHLRIDYGEPPQVPELPDIHDYACTASYVYEESGAFGEALQATHSTAVAGLADSEGHSSTFGTDISAMGWAGCAAPKTCSRCASIEAPHPVTEGPGADAPGLPCNQHQRSLSPGEEDTTSFRCKSARTSIDGNMLWRGEINNRNLSHIANAVDLEWAYSAGKFAADGECVHASVRCNGIENCDDGSDEEGCPVVVGSAPPSNIVGETACPLEGPAFQYTSFRCGSGECVPLEARCNGQHNCVDQTDELNCHCMPLTGVTVESTSGRDATIERLSENMEHNRLFHDRDYTFSSVGAFASKTMVKYSNSDKITPDDKVMLKIFAPVATTVYVVQFESAEPAFLVKDAWEEDHEFTKPVLNSGSGVRFTPGSLERDGHPRISQGRELDEAGNRKVLTPEELLVENHDGLAYTGGPQHTWKTYKTTSPEDWGLSEVKVYKKNFPAGLINMPGNGHRDGAYLIFMDEPCPEHER